MAKYDDLIDLLKLGYYDSKAKAFNASKYVAKEDGKTLTSNDFTDTYKQKLDDLDITGEANVIETVKVDGVALTPNADKAVNVDLSAFAKTASVNAELDKKVAKEEGKGLSTNDYTTAEKTKLAGMDTAISNAINAALADINHFVIADVLPTTGDKNAIYLIPKAGGTGDNVKEEYCYIDGKWEHIGDTAPSLEGYVQESQITVATEADIDALFAE